MHCSSWITTTVRPWRRSLGGLLGLCGLLSVFCQARATTQDALFPQIKRTMELIYDMQFHAALQAAQELSERAPTSPVGEFYRAAAYWQWRSITLDPAQRATLLAQFQEATQRAQHLAAALPKAQAVEASFYRGATYGMQARMLFAEKHYLKALLAAKQASAALQQCAAEAPDWHDVYLGLGTYHYVLARVPGFWRGMVQQFVGIEGDRAKGLEAMEHTRTRGLFAAPEAASLLAKVYALSEEQQYTKAHELLSQLVERYPHNFDYRYRLALVCAHLGLWERAVQLQEGLIADVERAAPYSHRTWLPLLRYRVAELHVLQGESDAATALLNRIRTAPLEAPLQAWVEVRLGNIADLRGQWQEAQHIYARITGEDEAERVAKSYRTRPFVRGRMELKPLEQKII